jgi:hypothetical protein
MKKTTRRSTAVTKAGTRGAHARTAIADQADRMSGRSRSAQTALGPGAPAMGPRPDPGPVPNASDASPDDPRHRPLRHAFPWAINQVWTPRRHVLTPFATLRNVADVSDLTRICIETRKDQLTSLGYDVAPRDTQNVTGQRSEEVERQVKVARDFFRKPDLRRPFSSWLRMAVEEVLVIDALSIYRRPTRGRAAGLEGYQTACLEIKDGATFLPLLDEGGDIPLPPQVAYRQIIHGQPVMGGDCSVDQLYYRPRTERSHTPYGLSPTEAVLLSINAALNRQLFNLAYYTEGNVPEGLLEAPQGFTTAQLMEFQDFIDDYLSGELGRRRKLKVVHSGSKVHQFKDPDFTTNFDEWLLKVHCAAFAIPPQEIGFTADVNRSTGEQQENIAYRRGVRPMGQFFKDLFDEVLAEDLGVPHLQWVWIGGEQEDKKLQAEVDGIYVRMGKVSVDELRIRDGQAPIGLGPYVDTAMGPIFVEELLAGGEPDDDPLTTKPKPKAAEEEEAEEPIDDAAKADLAKWKAVALKAVKAGRPVKVFASEAIPLELHARLERFLAKATDVGQVVMAFELAQAEHQAVSKAGESRVMTAMERRAAKAYQRLMKRSFGKLGKDFTAHVKENLS